MGGGVSLRGRHLGKSRGVREPRADPGKSFQGGRNHNCKGPRTEVCLAHSRMPEEAGQGGWRGRKGGRVEGESGLAEVKESLH